MNIAASGSNISSALHSTINRLEKLHEQKQALQADIKEIFAQAKVKGLDIGTVKEVLKLRSLDAAKREEREHLRDVYLRAMGLLDLEEV